ncbi:MAG: InlB B-repeat-containing protein, partial [Clostridia bacterium]|nr:InlB B-repeat-containing protein [Clostridia bacterium]
MNIIKKIVSLIIILVLSLNTVSAGAEIISNDDDEALEIFGYSNNGYTTYTVNDMEMLWPTEDKYAPGTSVKCTGVQGLNVGKNYIYSVKTDSNDKYAVFDRININTGAKEVLNYYSSKSASSPSACNTVWHANDLFVGGANDVTALFVATTETDPCITRMEISGSNLYFTGFFNLVDPNGTKIAAGGLACVAHSGGYFYMLVKQSKTNYYFTKIPDAATGGTAANPTALPCVKVFSVDMKNLIVAKSNSSYGTLGNEEVWVTQGFCYNSKEKAIYVPMFNGMENEVENIIICFDVKDYVSVSYLDSLTKNQSKMLFPSRTSFHIIDNASTKFEIENCGFRTSQDENGDLYLYFNTNSNVASREGIGRILYKSGSATHDSIVDENSIIYTVAYNGNGGAMPEDVSGYYRMTATTHIKGLSNKLRPNSFERSGYTFAGWYLNRSSDNKWLYFYEGNARWYTKGAQPAGAYLALYADRKSVSALTSVNGDKITCYAQWTPVSTGTKTYYFQYDANGGTGTMEDQKAIYGDETVLRKNTFKKDGYVFMGWSAHRRSDNAYIYIDTTSSTLSSVWLTYDKVESKYLLKTYTDGCSVYKTGATDCDIVTLYAVWGKSTGNSPGAFEEGTSFSFGGAVTACSPSIYKVYAAITDSSGQTVLSAEENVCGAEYDLSSLSSVLDTSVLQKGQYTYTVYAKIVNTKDSIESIKLQENAFTVTEKDVERLVLTDSAASSGKYELNERFFRGLKEMQSAQSVKELFRFDVSISASGEYVGTGSTISCAGKTVTVIVKGDIDGDGKITVNDYSSLKSYFKTSNVVLSGETAVASDTDGND